MKAAVAFFSALLVSILIIASHPGIARSDEAEKETVIVARAEPLVLIWGTNAYLMQLVKQGNFGDTMYRKLLVHALTLLAQRSHTGSVDSMGTIRLVYFQASDDRAYKIVTLSGVAAIGQVSVNLEELRTNESAWNRLIEQGRMPAEIRLMIDRAELDALTAQSAHPTQ